MSVHFDAEKGLIGEIDIELTLPPEFPEKYRGAIVNAMELCSVKKHLHDPPEFKVTAVASETAGATS